MPSSDVPRFAMPSASAELAGFQPVQFAVDKVWASAADAHKRKNQLWLFKFPHEVSSLLWSFRHPC